MKRYPLTQKQFAKLNEFKDWDIKEIPFDVAKSFPNIPRSNDVIAVFASGDMNGTKLLNGIDSVMGMDVIAHETHRDESAKEPELNIYHCVIQKLSKPVGDIEYLMYAPSREETLFGHWKDYSVLEQYLEAAKGKESICDKPIEAWCESEAVKAKPVTPQQIQPSKTS